VADLSLKYLLLGEDRSASKSIKGVASTAEKSSSLFDGASKVWQAGAALAGAAVVKFGVDSVAAYEDAEKKHRVLEDAYKRFPAIADVTIASMDEQANALQNTTKFEGDAISAAQGMLAQYKLTGTQIQQLMPLILDYAEKTGKDLPSAVDVVGKAMMGQGRALKEVGINFKDTGSAAGNFTELMSGLRTQVGGFAAQEGATAEGRMEILKNKFGDLQEAIGQRLIPVLDAGTSGLITLVDVGGNLIETLSQIPGPVLAGAAAFGVWRLAGDRITGVAQKGAGPVKEWGSSLRLAGMYAKEAGGGFTGLKAGFSSLTGGLTAGQTAMKGLKATGAGLMGMLGGPWGIALTAATVGLTIWMQKQADAKAYADELTATLDQQTGAFTDNSRTSIVKKMIGDLSPEDVGIVQQLGINFGQLADAAIAGGPAFDEQRAKLVALVNEHQKGIGAFTEEGRATEGLMQSFLRAGDAANGARVQQDALAKSGANTADAADAAAGSSDMFAGAMGAVADAAKGASVDMSEVNKQLAEYYSRNMDAAEASIAYEAAVDDAAKALKENGRTLDINTAKGRANKSALVDLAKAAGEQSRKTLEAGGSMSTASKQIDDARTKFIKLATQMNGGNRKAAEDMANKFGLTKDAVRAMNGEINKTPPAKKTTVTVPTQPATRQAQSIRAEIAAIKGKTVPITLSVGASMTSAARSLIAGVGGIGHLVAHAANARGTASWRGGLTWVGEQGPELVKVPGGSRIYDANTSQAMARGGDSGGGGDINLTVQLRSPDGRLIQQELLRVKRQAGGKLGLD
jgi:hypothetical protein